MKKNQDFWLRTFRELRKLGHPPDKAREALHKLGPSQQQVADEIGIGRRCYNNYVAGIRRNRGQQKKIARFWRIPAKEYFADTYGQRQT